MAKFTIYGQATSRSEIRAAIADRRRRLNNVTREFNSTAASVRTGKHVKLDAVEATQRRIKRDREREQRALEIEHMKTQARRLKAERRVAAVERATYGTSFPIRPILDPAPIEWLSSERSSKRSRRSASNPSGRGVVFNVKSYACRHPSGRRLVHRLMYAVRPDALEFDLKSSIITNISKFSDFFDCANDLAQFAAAADAVEMAAMGPKAMSHKSIILPLPSEISLQARQRIAERISRILDKRNLAHVIALHRPDRQGDQRNFHMHIVVAARPAKYEQEGWHFALGKDSLVFSPVALKAWRRMIAVSFNSELAAAGASRRYRWQPLSPAEKAQASVDAKAAENSKIARSLLPIIDGLDAAWRQLDKANRRTLQARNLVVAALGAIRRDVVITKSNFVDAAKRAGLRHAAVLPKVLDHFRVRIRLANGTAIDAIKAFDERCVRLKVDAKAVVTAARAVAIAIDAVSATAQELAPGSPTPPVSNTSHKPGPPPKLATQPAQEEKIRPRSKSSESVPDSKVPSVPAAVPPTPIPPRLAPTADARIKPSKPIERPAALANEGPVLPSQKPPEQGALPDSAGLTSATPYRAKIPEKPADSGGRERSQEQTGDEKPEDKFSEAVAHLPADLQLRFRDDISLMLALARSKKLSRKGRMIYASPEIQPFVLKIEGRDAGKHLLPKVPESSCDGLIAILQLGDDPDLGGHAKDSGIDAATIAAWNAQRGRGR